MPPCKHHEICGRDALEGEDLCILHSHNPEKDKKLFDEALAEHREKKGDNFGYFVFPGDRHFRGSEFIEGAYFDYSEFYAETEVTAVDYLRGEFPGGANFDHAKLTEVADFGFTKFTEEANFGDAEFTEGVNFIYAEFPGRASFSDAKFTGEAHFDSAKFTETVWFGSAKFAERAYFCYAEFRRRTNFPRAEFTQGADFRGTTFAGEAFFQEANFLGKTCFSFQQGDNNSAQSHSGVDFDFRNVNIEPLDALSFRDADLRKSRFLGTDLRKAEFTNVTWPRIEDDLTRGVRTVLEKLHQRLKQNENLRWSAINKYIPGRVRTHLEQAYGRLRQKYKLNLHEIGNRFAVYDEVDAVEKGETDKYPHIERLYRELKQNYEDRRDYERASDFHYGEKEMRRKNPETNQGLRLLLILYWLVSGYGERWIRPLIWASGLLVVCAILYLCLGLHPKNGGAALTWMSGWDWLESTLYSFRVMTLLKPDDLVPDGLAAKSLTAIQSILGPIILGLFALAVRQRLKR